ncbi:MAG: riboflavin synthase [Ferruginibacter sp.]|nr:riboflavin synthase [Ferruginibacter sp.]
MFTGIIEKTGTIEEVLSHGDNRSFRVSSPLYSELKVDQSLSHDGVCLTIEELGSGLHQVTAVAETLSKTNLGKWQKGTIINLERCMQLNGRLDGHFVQGHVDTTAECMDIVNRNGSWEYRFRFPEKFANLIIEKGSITVNGISLTLFNISNSAFTVAIVPYTYEHTNLKMLAKGGLVNIEFDMIGKYVNRIQGLH